MSLDQAFRSLCRVLHITGETQVIDRILLEFAHCFWKDNASSAFLASHSIVHELFRSVDIVYVVLFALVLLNTDLHHTKLARTQRMAKSVFVRNTLELVFDICRQKKQSDNTKSAENTEKDNDSNAGAVDTRDTPENLKVWGKRLESALKDMYVAVSDVPMMQVQTHGAESVDSTSTAVNLSIDKPHSLETSIEQGTRGYPVIQGVLFTKQHMVERGERARDRTWRKVWVTINVSADRFTTSGGGGVEMYVNRLVAGKVVGKASDFGPDEGVTTPIIGHGRDMYLSVDRHAILKPTASPKESPDAYNTPNGDADEDKTREIDLSDTYPVYAAMGATPTAVTPPMHIVYKLISQAPQIHSLIHACAGKVAYAPGRPRVFFVNFANGATHLFSCPGPGECALEAWVTWINYYAGSFSKRLGEEGISSMDYGWKLPVLPSSHSSSAGMLSPELLSVVSNGSLSGKSIKSALGSKSQQEKVVKLDTWTKPTISTRLVSTKTIVSGFDCSLHSLNRCSCSYPAQYLT